MSKQVDERVVSMQFDNKHFEKNVQTTMGTLDDLKQKLNLEGASKGLENINTAAKKVDMSNIGNGIETVRAKFSALQVMAVTALANITNSAVNAGKNLVKSFTIDPIKTGFQEYETQINAVQTILANTESKGSTLQDVNNALAELNTYADKTIYNFTEMTRNIGTFTAAGVDLKTSVSAIKGIANLAAVSGSTSQQASTAMYQLSQALSSGSVKLQDWNSVVNAGMGGQVFQDALKQTARIHGIAIDSMIEEQGSFRETLKDGWLTADILTETLNQFTLAAEEGSEEWENYKKSLMDKGYTEEQALSILKLANTATDAATKVKTFSQLMDTLKEAAQSGWTQSWQTMIGDFEEAKSFFTDVSNRLGEMIGESADARNKMLSEGLSSGWKQLLNAGISDEEGYKEIFKSVAEEHGTSVDEMIAAEKELDESLSDSEAFQKALKKGFTEGKLSSDMLAESVHKMAEEMSNMSSEELEAAGYTADHVTKIIALSESLKNGSISMDEFVKKITRTSGRENIIQALWNSFDALMNIVIPVKEAFREIFPPITGDQLYEFTERIRDLTADFKELTAKYAPQIKSTFKGFFSIIKIGITIIKDIAVGISNLIGKFSGLGVGILDATSSIGNWITGISESMQETDYLAIAISKVVDFLAIAKDKVIEFFGKTVDKIQEFSDKIHEFTDSVSSNDKFQSFLTILETIWNAIKKIGSVVTKVGAAIGKALATAFKNGNLKNLIDLVNSGIFTSILLGLNKWISGLQNIGETAKGFTSAIKNIFDTVGDSLKSWQENIKSKTITNIAIAIGILAVSLWILSGIDAEKLGSALTAITVVFIELMGAMKFLNKMGSGGLGGFKAATMMIGMSVAVLILASAVRTLADIDLIGLGKSVAAVGILLLELVGACKLMSLGGKKMQKGAIQMILMAAALKILASVCADLSTLSWNELGKGVAGIGAILLIFAGYAELIKLIKPKKLMRSALALVIIGAAMGIFADVCKKFGEMSWESLGKAGAAIGGILLLAAGFGLLSRYTKKMMRSSIALVIIGAVMEIFADVCKKFGEMSWDSLSKAGAAIGGILLIASGFGLLSKFTKKLMRSSIALVVIGAAMEIFADVAKKFGEMSWESLGKAGAAIGGILLLASGFALLSGLSKKMFGSIASLTIMAVAMEIFADVAKKFGEMSWESLGKAGAAIGGILLLASGFALLSGLSKNILASAGSLAIMAVALAILTPVLTTLGNMSWTEIAKGLVTIAGTFIIVGIAGYALRQIVPVIIALSKAIAIFGFACLAVGAGVMFLSAGLLALSTVIATAATAIVAALSIIITGILELIPTIVNGLTDAIVAICQVFIQAVPAIGEAIRVIVTEFMKVLLECAPTIIDGVLNIITQVLQSLVTYMPQILDSLINIFLIILKGLSERMPELISGIVTLFVSLIDSLASNIAPLIASVLNLLTAIFQGIADAIGPVVEALLGPIFEIFQNIIIGIVQAIAPYMPEICEFFTGMTQIISDAIVKITEILAPFIPYIKEMVVAIFENIAPIIDSIANIIQVVANFISQIVETVLEKVQNIIIGIVQAIAPYIPEICACVTEMTQIISDSIVQITEILAPFIPEIQEIVASVTEATVAICDAFIALVEQIAPIIDSITGLIEQLGNTISQILDSVCEVISVSADSISEVLNSLSETISTCGDTISEVFESISETIETTFNGISEVITSIGDSIKSVLDGISGVISSIGEAALNAGTGFDNLANGVKTITNLNIVDMVASLTAVAAGIGDIAAHSDGIASVGEGMNQLANGINISEKAFDKISKGITEINKSFSNVGTSAMAASTVLNTVLASMLRNVRNMAGKLVIAGKSLMLKLASGIKSGSSAAYSVMLSVISRVASGVKMGYSSMYSSGEYLGEGLINGINDKQQAVRDAAYALGQIAVQGEKDGQQSESPSKLTYQSGIWFGEGLVNGIRHMDSAVYNEGKDLGKTATGGLSKAISKISDVINSDIDTQPTIRPVLDLSGVAAGAGRINGMFDMNPSVGVMANVRSISSTMNKGQNGVNDDVVSALKDLGKQLGNTSGDTYNINGVTYDDGSNVSDALKELVRAARIERRR